MGGNLGEKIQSIRESFQASYVKPSPDLVGKYRQFLSANTHVLDYLQIGRGLTAETIENFKLGYDPDRNAVSIPIYKRGELINIRYRHLDENAKAKYTQEKGCEVWLFNEEGVAIGQKKGGVLIVEGEFDCMSGWQAGFKNIISPASGKDSFGVWLELLDSVPKVYVSYDNDKPGKGAALELANRVGTEKSFEVLYPDGCKDANDYFKSHNAEEYKNLIRQARPFYKYTYQGLDSVIDAIKARGDKRRNLDCLPYVNLEDEWMTVVSGRSGIGKTTYVMNIAQELTSKNIPTLIIPYERGVRFVGFRFLQVLLNKTVDDLSHFSDEDWAKVLPDVIDIPLYFSLPEPDKIKEIVEKARRLFGVKCVIIDHLDYGITSSSGDEVSEMRRVLQEWKSICLQHGIMFFIVHHIKKEKTSATVPKKPTMEDLKGGSSAFQIPEAVVIISEPERGQWEIDVVKNTTGDKGSKIYNINLATGKIGDDITESARLTPAQKALNDF